MKKIYLSVYEHPAAKLAIVLIVLMLSVTFSFCQCLVAIGHDISISTNEYHRPDTIFYRGVCNAVSKMGGGTVALFPIGNPSPKSGIRCTLLQVPEPETGLTLSKRKEQLEFLKTIKKKNEKSIQEFLRKVQTEVFADSPKQWQTDLNGFFKKVDVLLLEPQHQSYDKFVFVVSDGVQSIGNKDVSSKHRFKCKKFNLCLCGWKTALPDSINVTQFEDIDGFMQYINQNVKL